MVLHGSGNLVQRPFFHLFFLGPGILFALDKLVSMARKKANIAVMKAELLPSGEMFGWNILIRDDPYWTSKKNSLVEVS